MKQKILFLTKHFLAGSAVSNCLQNLIEEMREKYEIEVLVYGKVTEKAKNEDVKVHVVDGRNLSWKEMLRNEKNLITLMKYFLKRTMARFVGKGLFPLWDCETENIYLYDRVEEIVSQNRYDYIISVCDPFKCHYFTYKLRKKNDFKWITYYFDPYTFNYANQKHIWSTMRAEKKILEKCDAVLCPDTMYQEFSLCALRKYLPKMVVCEFPNLAQHASMGQKETITFDKEQINCVFVGNFYKKIREPWFLMELLLQSDCNIQTYIIGDICALLDQKKFSRYQERLGERLQCVGNVSKEEAFAIMEGADILVNIGNTVTNQLPSKIFDYISTGKPIVNLCKIKNCPTLPYTKKYPLSLDLFEEDGVEEEIAQKFSAFCNGAKGKRVDFEEIRETYLTSTPEYVAGQIEKVIEVQS